MVIHDANRGRPPAGRHGLARGDLIVIIIILLVLTSLLAPLLLRGRESADRVHCANNLRQLGAAVLKYQDERKALPPARVGEQHATWAVLLAPYLVADKKNPLLSWDVSKPYYLQTDAVREASLAVFYCPARRRPPQKSASGDVPTTGKPEPRQYAGALGDYGGVAGDGDARFPWDGPEANGPLVIAQILKGDGDLVLEWRSRVKLSDLERDREKRGRGLAHVLLLGDKYVPEEDRGRAAAGDGSLYNGNYPASSARVGGPGFGLAQTKTDPFNRNFGSDHVGVCQFIAADTSLHALALDVKENVLAKMMTRSEVE